MKCPHGQSTTSLVPKTTILKGFAHLGDSKSHGDLKRTSGPAALFKMIHAMPQLHWSWCISTVESNHTKSSQGTWQRANWPTWPGCECRTFFICFNMKSPRFPSEIIPVLAVASGQLHGNAIDSTSNLWPNSHVHIILSRTHERCWFHQSWNQTLHCSSLLAVAWPAEDGQSLWHTGTWGGVQLLLLSGLCSSSKDPRDMLFPKFLSSFFVPQLTMGPHDSRFNQLWNQHISHQLCALSSHSLWLALIALHIPQVHLHANVVAKCFGKASNVNNLRLSMAVKANRGVKPYPQLQLYRRPRYWEGDTVVRWIDKIAVGNSKSLGFWVSRVLRWEFCF